MRFRIFRVLISPLIHHVLVFLNKLTAGNITLRVLGILYIWLFAVQFGDWYLVL